MKEIADSGLLIGLLDPADPYHVWAREAFPEHAPFYTCDAVIAEAAAITHAPLLILGLITRGDLILDREFVLADELPRVLALATKYADHPMDLADACVVRMTELTRHCKVWTVDRGDFSAYRRHGREPIPCEFPPD